MYPYSSEMLLDLLCYSSTLCLLTFQSFKDQVIKVQNWHVPVWRRDIDGKVSEPWMGKDVVNLAKKKKEAHARFKRMESDRATETYKELAWVIRRATMWAPVHWRDKSVDSATVLLDTYARSAKAYRISRLLAILTPLPIPIPTFLSWASPIARVRLFLNLEVTVLRLLHLLPDGSSTMRASLDDASL